MDGKGGAGTWPKEAVGSGVGEGTTVAGGKVGVGDVAVGGGTGVNVRVGALVGTGVATGAGTVGAGPA